MANHHPLRPDEDEYRTEIATEEVEPESGTAVEGSPPWVLLGVVLLVIFVVVLAWAVLLPVLA